MPLSLRCSRFLGTYFLSKEIRDTSKADGPLEADILSVEQGRVGGPFKGVVIPVYGGDLYGWCCIGTRRPIVHTTPNGLTLINVAEHTDAQCAIAMSGDGRIGVSWSGEFLPRYSHMTHFLEAIAMWSDLLGWRYVDIVQSEPEQVLRRIPGCQLIPEASGEYVRWWMSDEYAVFSEPRLADPVVSPLVHVTVIAKTGVRAEMLVSKLRQEIPGSRPEFFLRTIRAVGEGHPEVPMIWGEPSPAGHKLPRKQEH